MDDVIDFIRNGEKVYQYIDDDGIDHYCGHGSCVICQHCTDLFLDPWHGNSIYAHVCELNVERGEFEECEHFLIEDDQQPITEQFYKDYQDQQIKLHEEIQSLLNNPEIRKKVDDCFEQAFKEYVDSFSFYPSEHDGNVFQMYVDELNKE